MTGNCHPSHGETGPHASLDGLAVLKNLTELEIHRCWNLVDVSALPRIAPNLRRLLVTTSSRLVAQAGVLDHPKLQTAWIDGTERLEIHG